MGHRNGKWRTLHVIKSWADAVCPLRSSGHSSSCSLNWLTWWLHSKRQRQKGQNHFQIIFSSAENILSPRRLSDFLTFIRPSKALSIYLITLSCTLQPLQLRKLIEFYLVILPPSAQCRQLINTFNVLLRLIWVGWLVLLEISCLRRRLRLRYVLLECVNLSVFGFSLEQRRDTNYFMCWSLQGNLQIINTLYSSLVIICTTAVHSFLLSIGVHAYCICFMNLKRIAWYQISSLSSSFCPNDLY